MTPGPILILLPPGCERPVRIATMNSGNTFGAEFWSDGKMDAPMMPDRLWLQKSPDQGVLFWTDACEEIGRYDPYNGVLDELGQWKGLRYAEEPTEEDYFTALAQGMAGDDDKRQAYLRRRIWWAGNDPIRCGEASALTERHVAHLEAFLLVLDEADPQKRLAKAEVFRELGRFDEAREMLRGKLPERTGSVAKSLWRLIEEGEVRVARI